MMGGIFAVMDERGRWSNGVVDGREWVDGGWYFRSDGWYICRDGRERKMVRWVGK